MVQGTARATITTAPHQTRQQRRAAQRAEAKRVMGAVAVGVTLGMGASTAHALQIIVSNTNDDGTGSLRRAIEDANANGGLDDVVFQSNVRPKITLTTGEIPITDSVDIQGPGANVLTVSGNDNSRIFNIDGPGTLDVTISGLTLTDGFVGSLINGGAIRNEDENLILEDSVITGNEAGDRGGGERLVGPKQILAGQRAKRDRYNRRRTDDRLRRRQDDSSAPRLALGNRAHHKASLPRPSPRSFRETRSSTAFTSFGSSSE